MSERERSAPDVGGAVSPLQAARMDKSAFSVVSLDEADAADKAFWASQTPTARLEALEFMRQVVYGYDPITDRIQRVLEFDEPFPR